MNHDNGYDRQLTESAYSVDPHTQLMLDAAADAENERVEFVLAVVNKTLNACTSQQRQAWRLRTGLDLDGTLHTPKSEREAGRIMGVDRASVQSFYLRADNAVLRALLQYTLGIRLP